MKNLPFLYAHLFLISVGATALILLAGEFMRWFSGWLRVYCGLPRTRPPSQVGVPPFFTGNFERLLAFAVVVLRVGETTAFALLAGWLGAKLAASWHRVPVKSDKRGRDMRAGTLSALMTGIVSISLGALIGFGVRFALTCL